MGWVLNASHQINAQSKYPTIIAVCVVLTLLMLAVVVLRLYLHTQIRQVRADDYVIIATATFAVVYAALAIAQTRYGLGLPLDLRPKKSLDTYLKVNFAGRPFYQIGIAGFKLALCISYLRLLSGTQKGGYRILVLTVAVVSTLGHVAGALVLIFNCTPVSKSWNSLAQGTCLPFGPTNYALAGFTIVCDVVVILVPIPLLVKLHMRLWKKAVLCCLFLLGLFTTMCSILRLLQISVIAYGDGNSTMLVLWGIVEFNIGIIISSVPFLAPLVKRHIQTLRTKITSSGKGSGSQKYKSRGYRMAYLPSHNSTVHHNHGGHGPTRPGDKLGSTCDSEEQIIREGQMDEDVIRKTTEYRVSISSQGGKQDSHTPDIKAEESSWPV